MGPTKVVPSYKVGDLVHIPQSTTLLDCATSVDPQLTIPLRVEQTKAPTIGIVTHRGQDYVQVYCCDGNRWSVADKSIYPLGERK